MRHGRSQDSRPWRGRRIHADDPLTQTLTAEHQAIGTAAFGAPEIAFAPSEVCPATDLYSLACTAHFLLTASHPYQAHSSVDAFLRHRDDPPPSVTDARDDVPADLTTLLSQMLAKSPADRPADAATVVDRLAHYPDISLAGLAEVAPAEPLPQPISAASSRSVVARRIGFVVPTAAFVVLILALFTLPNWLGVESKHNQKREPATAATQASSPTNDSQSDTQTSTSTRDLRLLQQRSPADEALLARYPRAADLLAPLRVASRPTSVDLAPLFSQLQRRPDAAKRSGAFAAFFCPIRYVIGRP
ncbi:MAG: hypothetical protein R3C05_22750 [Pirellulaceae bacterium]